MNLGRLTKAIHVSHKSESSAHSAQPQGTWSAAEPKVFGWLINLTQKLINESKLSSLGQLTECEAHVLAALFICHIEQRLQSFTYGFGILERYLTPKQAQALHREQESVRERLRRRLLQQRREFGPHHHALVQNLAADLRQHRQRILRLFSCPLSPEQILARELPAGVFLLKQIHGAWSKLPPAYMFLLLGGEDALTRVYGGRIPSKGLGYAIYHVCVRGTLTSADDNVYQNGGGKVPNRERIRTARRFCEVIPTISRIYGAWGPRFASSPKSPLAPPLRPVAAISKSPGG